MWEGDLSGLEGVPKRHIQGLKGAGSDLRTAETEQPAELTTHTATSGNSPLDCIFLLFLNRSAMNRRLQLLHFLITLPLVSGTPFHYNMFQGNAYSAAETRQRNKWVT